MSSLRDQLMRVRAEAGALTPAAVIEAATPEESPLHARYEWDNGIAGHKYRLIQAAEDIRSIRVIYAEDKRGPKSVRAFMAVRADVESPSREYVPTEEALADPFMRALLLREMEREIASLRMKYGHMKEFAGLLLKAVEEVA